MKETIRLYSCDFKKREKFEQVLGAFYLTDEIKDVVQLTIMEDGRVYSHTTPCGTGGCKNIARCKQKKGK